VGLDLEPAEVRSPTSSQDKIWKAPGLALILLLTLSGSLALLIFFRLFFSVSVENLEEEDHRFHIQPRRQLLFRRIPRQLVLTSKQASLAELPEAVRQNVKHMLALSPGIRLRWLGDADCEAYIRHHFDEELVRIFEDEARGSFRGDICRACVLSREGGFYVDLDVELRVSLDEFVDVNTTFVSAYTEDQAVLNALLAAAPRSPVMLEVIKQIRSWYRLEVPHEDQGTTSEWLGPVTMLRALRTVVERDCKGEPLHPEATLQWTCGPHVIRLYEEHELDCSPPGDDFPGDGDPSAGRPRFNEECPEKRARSEFMGVRFGIFTPEPQRRLVAWPRFASCSEWGCNAGGWDEGLPATAQPPLFAG